MVPEKETVSFDPTKPKLETSLEQLTGWSFLWWWLVLGLQVKNGCYEIAEGGLGLAQDRLLLDTLCQHTASARQRDKTGFS